MKEKLFQEEENNGKISISETYQFASIFINEI